MPTYSFSIKECNTEDLKVIKQLKKECSNKGMNFSYVVVKAIKEYLEANERNR